MKQECNYDKKQDWTKVLVTGVIFLFSTSILLYTISEKRRDDNEYFKGRLASLETRMNEQDKRIEGVNESLKKINTEVKDMSVLLVQINANVLENSKRLEDVINPPKPLVKKGKPKSAFNPEKLYVPPIQGPKPQPPVHDNKGIPRIEGKPN